MDTITAFIVMGVCGSGKTTVGSGLASTLGIPFYDADDFHSPENKKKMGEGIPLNDGDRYPWLKSLRDLVTDHLANKKSLVLACSALRQVYRDILAAGDHRVVFVYLKGTMELFRTRMSGRKDHYMKPGMLDSQFAALEEPVDAIVINASLQSDEAVKYITRLIHESYNLL